MSFHFGIQMRGRVIFFVSMPLLQTNELVTLYCHSNTNSNTQCAKTSDITGCAEFLSLLQKKILLSVFASYSLKPAVFAVESRSAAAPCGKTHRW